MTASTSLAAAPRGLDRLFVLFAAVLAPIAVLTVNPLPVLLAGAAVGAIALMLRDGMRPRPDRIGTALVLALLAWAAVSTAWVPRGAGKALVLVVQVGLTILPAVVLADAARRLDGPARRRMARAFLAGLAVAIAWFLVDRATGLALSTLVQRKPVELVALNRTASFMAIAVWPAAAALVALGRRRAALAALLAGVPLVLLFYNETAKLAVPAGFAAALLAFFLPRTAAVLGLLALVPFALTFPWTARILYATGLQDVWPIYLSSLEHRLHIWAYASDLVRMKPWFGWGFDASRHFSEIPALAYRGDPRVAMALHPHDASMQVWLELGLPGALLGTAIVVRAARALLAATRRMRALAAGYLMTTATIVLISYGIWQERWMATFLCLGVVLLALAPADAAGAGKGADRSTGTGGEAATGT